MTDVLDRRSVFARVHAVMTELPAIPKASNAPANMGGYSFRGIEDITATLKPLLAKHGVFMAPTVVERLESVRTTANNKALYVVDLRVRFSFYGVNNDEVEQFAMQHETTKFDTEVWGQGSDSGDKATQKALTSAFKSMLAITFCISDGENDAERHDVPETTVATAPPEGFESMEEAKATVDALRAKVIELDLAGWMRDQGFTWPWTRSACNAIAAKCAIREEELSAPFVEPRNEDGTAAPSLLDTGKTVDQGKRAMDTAPL